ncbi:MHC class II transactivator isoform X2 [Hoplias malabaricus]|uniref:MHC class II transactivator isoform X2 n=1 Tax=Hoplias malabaricus TaxID=27720 RepID=UPI00346342AF
MVPFQDVLSNVKKLLQGSDSDLLLIFLSQLLEANVFSAQYFQSLFHSLDHDLENLSDVEDQARRLALPIWQKWDVSKEILFSALDNMADPQPGDNGDEQIAPDQWRLEIPDSVLLDIISNDLTLKDIEDLAALCADLKEFDTTAEPVECPAPEREEKLPEKRPRRKRAAEEQPAKKTPRVKRKRADPPSVKSPPAEEKPPVSDVVSPQILHVPCVLNSAPLPRPSGPASLQIILSFNQLPPSVPLGPTYVLVSPPAVGPVTQIVPLSPTDGAVAPVELSMVTHPPSSLSDTASRGEQPSPLTPTSPDKTPLEEHTHTAPPSPVIPKQVEDYIQQLKSHLRETCSLMPGNMRMDTHYINTPLVQRKLVIRTGKNANKCLEKELVPLSNSERRKATMDRNQVFQKCGPKPKRLITILGKAGNGKSMFIQHLALDWTADLLPQFQFVFLLNCKVLDLTRPNYSLKDLLFNLSSTTVCDDSDSEVVFEYICLHPDKVLIVFDSFDDIGDLEGLLQSSATSATDNDYSVRQLFSGLSQKKILSGCTLLIASRPKDVLNQLLRKVDSILELGCFSPEDIDLYISNYFADPSKQERALKKIQSEQYIFSLCSSPLLCSFTCFLLKYNEVDGYVLPTTLTDLCLKVFDQCLELKTKEQGSKQDITQLCTLAWEGFKSSSSLLSQDQKFSQDFLDYCINCEVLASKQNPGKNQITYFSNLYTQNLLSTLHLLQSKDVNNKTLLAQMVLHPRRKKGNGECQDILQRFVMGLLYQNSSPVLECTANSQAKRTAVETHLKNLKPGNLTPSRLLELFHCIYEANNIKLAKLLVKNLPEKLSFCGTQLTPTDTYIISNILQNAKSLKLTFSIDLRDTCVPLSGLKDLVALGCITSFRAPTMDTIDLWEELHRSSDDLTLKHAIKKFTIDPFKVSEISHIETLQLLVQIHIEKKLPMGDADAALENGVPAVRNLHKLECELGQQNGSGAFLKLTEILPALESLQHLDLENNKLGNVEAEKLAKALQSLTSLKMLNLSQNCIGDAGAQKLALALSTAASLQSLSLYENFISDAGAENLASVLPAMKSLLDLDVKYNKFTDVGAKKLSAALKNSPSMKSLQMWNNCIPLGVFGHLRLQDSRIKPL